MIDQTQKFLELHVCTAASKYETKRKKLQTHPQITPKIYSIQITKTPTYNKYKSKYKF